MGLVDSALNAPMASFGDQEAYPDLIDKAAVLAVRIARNHPLPDGNKRLAWQALSMFLALNGWTLEPSPDEAVAMMLAVAAGELDERGLAISVREHAEPCKGDGRIRPVLGGW